MALVISEMRESPAVFYHGPICFRDPRDYLCVHVLSWLVACVCVCVCFCVLAVSVIGERYCMHAYGDLVNLK